MNFMRLWFTQLLIYFAFIGLTFLLPVAPATAGKIYKYVDEHGKIHYSDHPFTYLQKKFNPDETNTAYNKKKDALDTKALHGVWTLTAHSKFLGSDTTPGKGVWQFNRNGTLLIKEGKDISSAEYRAQGHLLEIQENRSRTHYRIISLTPSRLIIHQSASKSQPTGRSKSGKVAMNKKNAYLYFSRGSEKHIARPKSAPHDLKLYRRDQVAILFTMFSCSGVVYSELSEQEKKEKSKEIFTATGIENFNDKIYTDSLAHYKNDDIYKQQYQPHIDTDIKNCRVPKFDAK